jgi:hypothetical protein
MTVHVRGRELTDRAGNREEGSGRPLHSPLLDFTPERSFLKTQDELLRGW